MTGVPEMLILRLLAEREMYGYELVQAIEVATGEAIRLGEGVVYPVLHALEESGCLRARRKPVSGRTRVYYSLTAAGKKRLAVVIQDWKRIAGAVAQVLKGAGDAAASV
jgi:PadR family transcriptional regulator PadR